MPWFLVALLAAATGALIAYARKGEAANVTTDPQKTSDLDALLTAAARRFNIDADLLRAIAFIESGLNAQAVRWNPPNDVSVGVGQILCTPPDGVTAGADYVCQNRFDVQGWPTTFNALKDPAVNVPIMAEILAFNLRNYGFPRGVAVYNDYAARHAGEQGPFPNDVYVSRVLARLSQLKGKAA